MSTDMLPLSFFLFSFALAGAFVCDLYEGSPTSGVCVDVSACTYQDMNRV